MSADADDDTKHFLALNYQSLENGEQMLQFAELPQNQNQHQAQLESNNPKSKTTNMSSLLKQINKSIERSSGKAQHPSNQHNKCKSYP